MGGWAAAAWLLACSGPDESPASTEDAAHRDADGGVSLARDEWSRLGYDAANSRHNRGETILDVDNVSRLGPKWIITDIETGVTSTPAVVDGVVYFGEWGSTVRAVRAEDGAEVWRTSLESRVRSSPLVTEDRVYVTASTQVVALRREDGAVLWSMSPDSHSTVALDSSPVLVAGRLVFGVASFEIGIRKDDYTFRGSVVAVDAETGDELWRVYTSQDDETSGAGVSVWSSAAVDESRKLVFIGTGNAYEEPAGPYSDSVLAIHYETGELVWHHQYTEGDVFTVPALGPGPDADVGASPNLFTVDGRDLVGAGDKGGVYKALDRETGQEVWSRELTRGTPLGGVMTTAAVDDEHIYVSSNTWESDHGSITFALRQKDGSVAWERPMPEPAFNAITLANGVLFQTTALGLVHALDARTGEELWSADLEADLGGGVTVAGGSLYVGRGFSFITTRFTDAGGFVAFELDGTAPLDFDRSGLPDELDGGAMGREECIAGAPSELPGDCATCACECDAATVSACTDVCWEFAPCIIESCGHLDVTSAAGVECVREECAEQKLVPDEVQEAVIAAAPCIVRCRDDC